MTKQQVNDSYSERHKSRANRTPLSEFLDERSDRLDPEPDQISKAVRSMEKAIMSGHVVNWARKSDLIGVATGFSSSLTDKQKAHEVSLIVDEMSSDTMNEFGDLRSFSVARNAAYLDAVKEDDEEEAPSVVESTEFAGEQISREDAARKLVEQSFGQLEQLNNDNFTLAA